ncbi:MAG: hypothetical protein JW990_17625 [Thermoleophilia bacterium]|nr:hypothetical protein [Thermoleophilia bacterium]
MPATLVVDGRGRGVVCRVGAATEVGRIAGSLGKAATPAPLVIRLRKFTRGIAVFILAALVVLAVGQVLRGVDLVETLLLASSLAVSATPAGLPVAVHFRLADAGAEPVVSDAVNESMSRHDGLRRSGARK